MNPLAGPLAELASIWSSKNKASVAARGAPKEIIPDVAGAGRRALERRREKVRRKLYGLDEERREGEVTSADWPWEVRPVPLADIRIDPNFKDTRIHDDPRYKEWSANDGQSLEDLCRSMESEGLKIPIVVAASTDEEGKEIFLLRAGGRRRKAAERLRWKQIPAIILPRLPADASTEVRTKYAEFQRWYNVLENTARKNLTTYELAVTARRMRDDHAVTAAEFSRRTGFSQGYVSNLLGCLDRLPEYLVEQWREGARVALDQWISLSYLDHEEAIRNYQRMVGMSPKERLRRALAKKRRSLPSPRWLSRMQRLYTGIEGSELPPRTRDLVLRAVEVCMGMRDDIPGVWEPGKQKKYEAKARLRRELALPELPDPGEDREMPPPVDEAAG